MAKFLATEVSRGMSIPQGGAVREDNQDVKVPVGPRYVTCAATTCASTGESNVQTNRRENGDADSSNQRSSTSASARSMKPENLLLAFVR